MADGDKGGKPNDPLHVPPGDLPSRSPASEWTASDRRGPLNLAEEDDVERVVPAHEIDAEGGIDRAVAPGEAGVAKPVHDAPRDEAAMEPTVEPGVASPGVAQPAAGGVAPEPRWSLVPVAAGLVLGAVIGAGSAWIVYSQGGNATGADKQVASLALRLDALEKRPDPDGELGRLKTGLAELQNKVGALAGAGSTAPDGASAAAASQINDVAAKVAGLQTTVAGLQSRGAPSQPGGGTDAAIAALQKDIAGARRQAEDAKAAVTASKDDQHQLGAKLAALSATMTSAIAKVEGAEKQAADARSGLEAVQGRQTTLEAKLGSPAQAVVADSLVEQVRTGQPFAQQVAALAALGIDPAKVAVLRERAPAGVASAQALLAEWKPLESSVIATGNKAPADAGFGQRLEHGLFGLVSVRRADGTVGNDLAAKVTAIDGDLDHGDTVAASAAWQALPPDAKARSASFGDKLAASASTLATARDLQRAAIEALGGKKS